MLYINFHQSNHRMNHSSFLILALIVGQVYGQCSNAPTVRWGGKNYLFSWEDPATKGEIRTWDNAQAMCRRHCMNLVSIESPAENNFIKEHVASGRVEFIWTSGRRRPGFDPNEGWYWAGSGVGIGSAKQRSNGDWSHTGGAGRPQPDNRENNPDLFGYRGHEESCLSFLNNFYNDGIKWHDVACYHTKPWVCEN